MSKEEILALIDAELEGNIMILIDPKKKDSLLLINPSITPECRHPSWHIHPHGKSTAN